MNSRNSTLRIDIAFLAMLLLIFAAAVFIGSDAGYLTRNLIILAASFIPLMFAYFTVLHSALLVSAVLVIVAAGISIMIAVRTGTGLPKSTYFFIFWIPLMTVCVHNFALAFNEIRDENADILRQLRRTVTVDQLTGAKNLRAFENDAAVYMSLSRRYDMQLVLIVWQLRHEDELFDQFGERQVIKKVTEVLKGALRQEDELFIVSDKPWRWAVMHFTDAQSVGKILDRIMERMPRIAFKGTVEPLPVKVEADYGMYLYDGSDISPLTFLNYANEDIG